MPAQGQTSPWGPALLEDMGNGQPQIQETQGYEYMKIQTEISIR